MKYRTLYRTIIRLATLLLISGCTKELPVGEELPEGEKFTRIVFTPSTFTKADAGPYASTTGNEDGIKSLDVYGIVRGSYSIVNIFHAPGVDPLGSGRTWGEIRGDTAVIMSSLFERNARGDVIKYVNLYVIANVEQLEPAYTDVFKSFTAYNTQIKDAVQKYLWSRQPINQNVEDILKKLVVKANGLSAALDYPVMAQSMKVEGGVSFLHMPLERIYCRIGFSFLFTGNSSDKIKIDKITIDKTSNQGYLFLEENEADNKTPLGSLVWSAATNGPGVFKDAKGNINTNGEQPTGGTLMTLYAESSSAAPLYFRTCQYLCDDEREAPSITLDITVTGSGGTKTRTLTAPLYSSGGIGGKKHYGFLRNHSYQVVSTINTSALQLEDVTVEMRDWNDRPSVDIPEFK
ncbi:hypothetical protein [Parabacteroides goldsteinii]|uniref:Major fimbrial subunit protein N-terminal domain-containing protein n=1 Tax=Parabacteroides goldsteinii DSM 19448 = WAL 12034 TaxID=927665 RepID=A0A0F5JQR7_9BACT|nr:hypothetical protein [Parabacteroides goldsteinii]KKB60141.1 hypothetical protein HMPREF1535_00417 [Parabacteroides goldsteinii DSM 19448 = WAL 12034]